MHNYKLIKRQKALSKMHMSRIGGKKTIKTMKALYFLIIDNSFKRTTNNTLTINPTIHNYF